MRSKILDKTYLRTTIRKHFEQLYRRKLTCLLSRLGWTSFLGWTSLSGSGAWLEVLPSRPLGLTLSDDEFRISAGLRLGAPVTAQHTCKCGYVPATDGRHALVCPKIKHGFIKHSNGNMIIKDSIKSLGIISTLEPIGLLRKDGRRPIAKMDAMAARTDLGMGFHM